MKRVRQLSILWFALLALPATAPVVAQCLGFGERAVVSDGTNGAEHVVVADIDDDGDLDLVTSSFGDGKLFWYENQGDPGASIAHLIADDLGSASDIFVIDLDGDLDLDVIVASRDRRTILWFEQAAGITPIFSRRTVTAEAELTLGIHAADVDGDGHVDVLSASFVDDTIAWYRSDGGVPPEFTRFVITDEAIGATSVWAQDIDGDMKTDVLTTSSVDGEVALYLQVDSGVGLIVSFEKILLAGVESRCSVTTELTCVLDADCPGGTEDPPQESCDPLPTAFGAVSVTAADLDDDGDTDVVAAALNEDKIAWYENAGGQPPTFVETEHEVTTQAVFVRSVRVALVDDDALPDLLSASYGDDKIAWYENNPTQPGLFTEHLVATDVTHADDVGAGDLDGDGETDIVSVSSVPGFPATLDRIAWYRNEGPADAPGFAAGEQISRSADGAVRAVAADINADGHMDVVTAGRTDRIAWYESDGAEPPTFVEHLVFTDAEGAVDVVAEDIDGDGDIDLVAASQDDGMIRWFESDLAPIDPMIDRNPNFTTRVVASDLINVQNVIAVDFDGNGKFDLVSAEAGELPPEPEEGEDPLPFGRVQWYENDDATPPDFAPIEITDDAAGARSVHAADMDADGDLDVLAALFSARQFVWYENTGMEIFDPQPNVIDETLIGPTAIYGADIDDDGDTDVIGSAAISEVIVLWLRDPLDDETPFTRQLLATDADDVTDVFAADLDDDGDLDIVSSVPGDGLIAWFVNDGMQPATFTTEIVTNGTDFALSSDVADIDGDMKSDLVTGQRLSVNWYQASTEICQEFDADGDGEINGVELAWIGRAFGLSSVDPAAEWWAVVDYTGDGTVDGEDLAVLASNGVFGFSTEDCHFICN